MKHSFTEITKKNTMNLAYWTFAWLISMALATFGPEFIWEDNTLLTILGIAVNLALGVGMIVANMRYIKGLDDLQKKIQLDAMAMALGVGVIGGLSYSLLDTTNIISGNAEISVLVILISISYMIGIFFGQKRYN
ncbi:hypothetical protein N9L20_02195 [Flavobacteriaceae bacterium]|nr:hypothetical protein [Flavobacteriaceae bacterium]